MNAAAIPPTRISAFLRRFQNPRQAETYLFRQENVLGTSFELRVRSHCPRAAENTERIALVEIDRLEKVLSSFDPASEFRQWQSQRGREIKISQELMEVLQACDRWQKRSRGAFNPASEVFSQIGKQAALENRWPSQEKLSLYAKQAAQTLWKLNTVEQTATYLSECPLTLNGIAKGYIVDRASEAAFQGQEAVQGLILNIGGDLRICSDREDIAGITDPDNDAENAPLFARIRLRNGAIATSGDWRRGFRVGGRFYSHIVDPRLGIPVDQIRSASVIAPFAVDTDALATIFSVLAPEDSIALADSLPGVGCLLIAQGSQVWRSVEWRKRELPAGVIRPY